MDGHVQHDDVGFLSQGIFSFVPEAFGWRRKECIAAFQGCSQRKYLGTVIIGYRTEVKC